MPPGRSIYAKVYIKTSFRARFTPRTSRPWRTKKLCTLTAFFRNRFYEIDRWYKARIEKPVIYPKLFVIEPVKCQRTLAERLSELSPPIPGINIGYNLAHTFPSKATEERPAENLEEAARLRKLKVDVTAVNKESGSGIGVEMARRAAIFYGLFKDLFSPDVFFNPVVTLNIGYRLDEQPPSLLPVCFGNVIEPSDAKLAPSVKYEAEQGSLWTLVMTNPDGNIYKENAEVLHWMICNIPESRISDGDVICPYLQPLPLRGTGRHRFAFLLFRQNARIDYRLETSSNKRLFDRTFRTYDFYKKYEDVVTPAGLCFFQSEWDISCKRCFETELNMPEPAYKYEWPGPFIPPQEAVPKESEPFNLYLDKYRDLQDIERELLVKRLSVLSPFKDGPTKLKYPNIFYKEEKRTLPSWLHTEKIKANMGQGKYRSLYENPLD